MRDEQQRAGELAQVVLQPADRVDVEVVRRLVEQEQIGLGDERLAEERASPPAAGQLAERTIGRQRQPRHDGLDTLLEPPSIALLELVLEVAQPLELGMAVGDLSRHVVILRDERAELAQAGGDFVEDRAIRRAGDVLIETRDAQPGRPPDRSAVGRDLAGDHLEQARLARPVAADEADALARLDAKAGVLEEGQVAERKRDAIQGE